MGQNHAPARRKALTVFSLTMITVGSVDSIRNLPITALFGSQLIFFFILAAIFFLLPSALISAELASAWPKQGGIYVWVKRAFGERFGLLAIWLQWIENVIWYPMILSFVAATLGYIINPALVHNKIYLVSVILVCFWGATFVNLSGMKSSAWFSNICAMSGLIIPMILIIALGSIWVLAGYPLQIHFTSASLMPHLSDHNTWISLTGIIMSLCGIEIATVHANDVENPQQAFPKALLYSVVIILSTLIFGALAIAVVIPTSDISLVAGIMQAFGKFFSLYHMSWFMPLIALMLVLGGLGSVSNWIIAPTKGLLVAAQEGNLPKVFAKENQHAAPTVLLIAQASIVSCLALVFLFMPSVNSYYMLLTALAAQLYMFMYILMFATGIYLRLTEPEQPRQFKIPGGVYGMITVAGMGIVGGLVTILVGFIPPTSVVNISTKQYELFLTAGLILMLIAPLTYIGLQRTGNRI